MIREKNNSDITIVADKGYLMCENDKKELAEINTTIITPLRSNQINTTSEEDKIKLHRRHRVENMFAKIKAYNRVHVRRDKLLANYMGFVYLACIYVS